MSVTIGSKGPAPSAVPVLGGDVGRVLDSRGKATPNGPTFGTMLAAARPILKGAESAATVLPGGPLIAAAIKGPSTLGAGAGAHLPGASYATGGGVAMTPRLSPASPGMTTGASPNFAGPGANPAVDAIGAGPGAGAVGGGEPTAGVESVLADSQAFNLYYLQLQEQISAEGRSYSALSNVLKARHDTVKNAIGNIR